MYRIVQETLQARIGEILAERFGVELSQFAMELPPKLELGEVALPLAFELAKRLKKAPRVIAAELQPLLASIEGVASVDVAGAGYLNIKLDRAALARQIARGEHSSIGGEGFRLIEHTSINPNKAAHVGHLRNAILGDTLARMVRPDAWKRGWSTGVQNYIDNTGVQVADIVVAVTVLEGKTLDGVREWMSELLETNTRLDYECWDLYARVSQWYEADPEQAAARKQLRLDTLHAIETGGNDTAEIADLLATGVLRRHLETMERLGIEYDFLPRESEILHLHFWEHARRLMVEKGVLYLETAGKKAGAWVMRRAGAPPLAEGEVDDDAKILIRSNGTVTYVGKDIAYHLWKFGLLGLDFGYAKFREYPSHTCWVSTTQGETPHPSFAHADAIYNVIDSRQDDPQAQVKEALRALGFEAAADRYTHLNYAFVALTLRTAQELGYSISEEDRAKGFVEVSGRKGQGVKADDLIDRMVAAARAEVDARHPELGEVERANIADAIGVGALRYFMLRFTRNTLIAFDFREALSFDGETGPYAQYAAVRAANIFRKAAADEESVLADFATLDTSSIFHREGADAMWDVWLTVSRLSQTLDAAITAAEPAILARYLFTLAQSFNNFYHRHHILTEEDATRRTVLLATAAVARRTLEQAMAWLGMRVPAVM